MANIILVDYPNDVGAMEKYWKIVGHEGIKKIYGPVYLPYGKMSESEIIILLQRLACLCLNEDEIIDASVRRDSKRYSPRLQPVIDPGHIVVGTGRLRYAAIIFD